MGTRDRKGFPDAIQIHGLHRSLTEPVQTDAPTGEALAHDRKACKIRGPLHRAEDKAMSLASVAEGLDFDRPGMRVRGIRTVSAGMAI